MNRWLGPIVAIVAVAGAFYLGDAVGKRVRPLHDVNPVGFHVYGQVQIPPTALNTSGCPATQTQVKLCTLTFDFALSTASTPTAQNCDPGTNCMSFTTPPKQPLKVTLKDSDGSYGPYDDYVSGQILATQ